MQREEGDQLADATGEDSIAAHDVHRRLTEQGVDLDLGVPVVGEQRELAQQVVESPACSADDDDSLRP